MTQEEAINEIRRLQTNWIVPEEGCFLTDRAEDHNIRIREAQRECQITAGLTDREAEQARY